MSPAEAKAFVLSKYPDAFPWSIMGDGIGISSHIAGRCIGMTLDGGEDDAWIDAADTIESHARGTPT